MIAEDPLALRFFLSDELYLLPGDAAPGPAAPNVASYAVGGGPQNTVMQPAAANDLLPEVPAPLFNHQGGYQKRILILVHDAGFDHLKPAHLTALENTLGRKHLNLADVGIVNMCAYPGADILTIGGFFKPVKILIMGEKALPGDMALPALNHPFTLRKCPVLYTFSFDDMLGNKDHTKAFWEQIKLFL